MARAGLLVGRSVRQVGVAGRVVGQRAAGLGDGAHGAQDAAHIRVVDDGHGLARRTIHRTALHAFGGIGQRMLVGAVGHGHALHADGEARGVHHDEHGVQATVLLADQVTHGAAGVAELQRGGGAGLDAELVLDGHAVHVVALAQRAVGVDQEFRHQEQRDALHALGRVGQAGQHQVDDVLGQIMLAVGDEDLGAGDAVAAVALRFGARAQQGQVRAGLRLGQVHGAGPLAGDHRADVALAQLGRAGGQQRLDGAVGQQRTKRERQVGGVQHFRGGRAQQAG